MGWLLAPKGEPLMRRYWLPINQIFEDHVLIQNDEFHHIFDVCRQGLGSQFEVLGKPNMAFLVEVTDLKKKEARAQILKQRTIQPLSKPHIKLILSIPRFQVMDAVVEKAVEMGVHSLQPVFSDFSFVRKTSSLPEAKLARWNKIIKSATQQTGRGEMMHLLSPKELKSIEEEINRSGNILCLFAYEGNAASSISEYLKSSKTKDLDEIWLFVGSEGGYSQSEVELFSKWGLKSVSLGDQILRVETACTALVAILKYEFGMMER